MLAQAVAAIALGLLAASGVAKLIDPEPTTGAMRAARLPASRALTYTLGATEVVVGTLGLVAGTALFVAALLYLAFSMFTFAAIRKRIPVQSCGCFGRDDTPPNALHLVYNVVASLAIVAATMLDLDPVDWSLPAGELVIVRGYLVAGVYASYLLLARLPQVLKLARP